MEQPPPGPRPPRILIALGWSGAIPFAAFAIGAWVGVPPTEMLLTAGALYAALILSFLGGAQWGLLTAGTVQGHPTGDCEETPPTVAIACISVIPCLVAWFAILVLDHIAPLLVLILAFPCVYALDRQLLGWGLVPPWWPRYRLQLTLFVTGLLVIGVGGVLFNG